MVILNRWQSLTAVIGDNWGWINNIAVTNLNDRVKRSKSVQNKNAKNHASCLQQDTKVKQQQMWESNSLFALNTEVLCLGQIQYNTLLSTTLYIFERSGDYIMLWVCLLSLRTGEFFRIKKKGNGAKHRTNLRGKPGSVCLTLDTGRWIHLSAGQ